MNMRDLNVVLQEKQKQMYDLQKQIDALMIVLPLVHEPTDPQTELPQPPQGGKRWP
jgi:hypothetical protein